MQVIMVTRLYAMYQRSRKILVLLIVTLILVQVSTVVAVALWQKMPVLAGKLRL
jgi:hypothetical protein